MLTWLSRKKKKSNSRSEKETDKSEDGNGRDKEYRRGEFMTKCAEQKARLEKHDEQAKEIYDGIETNISKLKKITKKLRADKRGLEVEDAA